MCSVCIMFSCLNLVFFQLNNYMLEVDYVNIKVSLRCFQTKSFIKVLSYVPVMTYQLRTLKVKLNL